MKIDYRFMRLSDHAAALRLWELSEGVCVAAGDSRKEIGRFLKRNPRLSHVARVDGELAGTALAGHDGRRGFIYHLAVSPECRQRGIGRRLVSLCLKALQAHGLPRCHIVVLKNNRSGLAFWMRLGWEHRDQLRIYSKTF